MTLHSHWHRECDEQKTQRNRARQQFQDANRGHALNNRFTYPSDLWPLPTFTKWLRNHVQVLRRTLFPILADVVRLSSLPSKVMSSYNKMWAYKAHFRCHNGNPASYVSYNHGVGVLESEIMHDSMDVGVLERIYMVSYESLNVVVMRVTRVKHYNHGRGCIKKNQYGFRTAMVDAREDAHRRNRFLLTKLTF